MAYALAGADCIDVAADPAVITTAKAALRLAATLSEADASKHSYMRGLPWLMVSLNDGEDPHFRKAEFNAATCPTHCTRPCELICPAQAIVFEADTALDCTSDSPDQSRSYRSDSYRYEGATTTKGIFSGVLSDRCYGCGRCLPICPEQQIATRSYLAPAAEIVPLVLQTGIDAIEIHTQIGHLNEFSRLWKELEPWVYKLKLVAISCPDGDDLVDYLRALYDVVSPLPCPLLWQLDGRPMSGDIGVGATRAAVKLGQKALVAGLPGYLQLAGGTNNHTVPKLKALNLLHPQLLQPPITVISSGLSQGEPLTEVPASTYIAGVAYGSYARALLLPILNQLDATAIAITESKPKSANTITSGSAAAITNMIVQDLSLPARRSQQRKLEDAPDLLWQAVALARALVSQLKVFNDCQEARLNL